MHAVKIIRDTAATAVTRVVMLLYDRRVCIVYILYTFKGESVVAFSQKMQSLNEKFCVDVLFSCYRAYEIARQIFDNVFICMCACVFVCISADRENPSIF